MGEMETTLGLLTFIGQSVLVLLAVVAVLTGIYFIIVSLFAPKPRKYIGESGVALSDALTGKVVHARILDAAFMGTAMEDIERGDIITLHDVTDANTILIKKYDPADEYTV